MSETAEHALTVFDTGLSCAEAVVLAGARRLGRESDLVPRVATGFGGGLSRTRGLCGALAGGVIVLGVALGRDRLGDDRAPILAATQDLVRGFRARFGSDNCYDLTGLDFNDPGAQQAYLATVHARCRGYVEWVAAELERLLPR